MANLSRRQFLHSTLLSGAGMLSSTALGSWFGCAANCVTRAVPPRYGRRVLADLHAHAMLNDWNARSPLPVKIPVLAKMAKTFFNSTKMSWESSHRAGIDLLCVTHFNVFDELESPTIPLGFTYFGVTVRLKYQSIALEKNLQGVFLELVLH